MNIQDIFWLSFRDLGEKRVRTALTMLMVMIGVASIIALVSQTQGISASIQSSLQSLGLTSIIMTSTRSTGFTIADTAAITTLPNVSAVVPVLTGSASLSANGQNSTVSVIGVGEENLQTLLGGVIDIYQGTVYNNTLTPSSLVGHTTAFPSALGGRENLQVGSVATLKTSGRGGPSYTIPIVGVLQSYGSSILSIDSSVIMSLQAAEALLQRASFNTILVKASNATSVSALSTQLTDIYGNNARVLDTQQLAATASSIIGSISLLLGVIAGISLLVAAIGIMNVMLMSVMERTHEIGIFKALGFKNRDVLAVFLFQAMIIGLGGGLLGIALGSGASYGLSFVISQASSSSASTGTTGAGAGSFGNGAGPSGAGGGGAVFVDSGSSSSSASSLSYQPVFTLATTGTALLIAVLVSVMAGLYPAWRASRMEPIDALRQL